jgi:hypothetical protein
MAMKDMMESTRLNPTLILKYDFMVSLLSDLKNVKFSTLYYS